MDISSSFTIGGASGVRAVSVGGMTPLLICGPCVIESREHTFQHAKEIKKIADEVGIPLVFKSSYDKANRTSSSSFRGMGIEEGLRIMEEVRREFGLPVITDVHSPEQVPIVAEVVDVVQIPAFLCRQSDLLFAAADCAKPVMVKKGQFVSPEDMKFVVEKISERGGKQVMLCERGACFGYRELVVDFRGLEVMRSFGCPVVFDATHSVQVMGGSSGRSGGNREYVAGLSRAAVAMGVDAVFLEAHQDPDNAPSDGPNMVPLSALRDLLSDLMTLWHSKLLTRKC